LSNNYTFFVVKYVKIASITSKPTDSMHNLLYRWLFFVCLLCLPIGSEANIASRKTYLLSNPAVVEQQSNGQIVSVFERIRIFKKLKNTLQKRVYTEGGAKPKEDKKNTLARRIFKILLLVAAGVLLIYWLQGTIALAILTGGGIAYWLNRDRIAERQRLKRERMYAYEQEAKRTNKDRATDSMSHPANRWTRRALTRFLIGVGLVFLGIIAAFLSFAIATSEAFAIFGAGLFILGYGFTLTSFFNAIKALTVKEPQSAWAWIPVILGLPFILSLLAILALGFG
jgi:Flp pilus assembly protein TadB